MGAVLVPVLMTLTACAGARLGGPIGDSVADPEDFAESLRMQTLPASAEQINFGWTLDEQGSLVRGRGVVRTEAAERIRLDLFGQRGDTYLVAALVDGQYRLPPEASNAVALPSPSLLWAALGILMPPGGAELTSATLGDGSAELRYGTGGDELFVFSFDGSEGGPYRIRQVQRAGSRGVLETLALDRDANGSIRRARYRNWAEYRELTLDVEEVSPRQSFPPSIWRPDGVAR